jgi:hypothetical protein
MKYFHYHNLIPYFDVALMDSETIVSNPKYASIGVTLETPPAEVAKKLYESKIIFIQSPVQKFKASSNAFLISKE